MKTKKRRKLFLCNINVVIKKFNGNDQVSEPRLGQLLNFQHNLNMRDSRIYFIRFIVIVQMSTNISKQ